MSDINTIDPKYTYEFKDSRDRDEDRVELRVFGPMRGDGYWAGNYTPDELDQFGLACIRAAQARRESTGLPTA